MLRNNAIVLMEAGNLLSMTGRAVVKDGAELENEGLYGNLTADEINKLLEENPEEFSRFGQALHQATSQMLIAIDDKDPGAIFELGSSIYQVCEDCHSTFWYPNQVLPEY